MLNTPDYVVGTSNHTSVSTGFLLDLVNAFACVGTAVALFSITNRQNESLALGFLASRMFEAAVIAVVSLLAVVTLRQSGPAPGATAKSLVGACQALVAVRDWTFIPGPGTIRARPSPVFVEVIRHQSARLSNRFTQKCRGDIITTALYEALPVAQFQRRLYALTC